MKIIDLLNKIANGEEVPKRIKYKDEIRDYNDKDKDYTCSNSKNYFLFFNILRKNIGEEFKKALNDEVEIIGEEKKLPKKLEEIGNIDYNLGYIDYKNIEVLKDWLNKDIQSILNELDLIVKNQNQLIDYLESKEKEQVKPLTKKDIEALGYACGEIKKCFTNGWTKSLENKPLEEEKKIPEKLEPLQKDYMTLDDIKFTFSNSEMIIVDKINSIIDYLESKEKGE